MRLTHQKNLFFYFSFFLFVLFAASACKSPKGITSTDTATSASTKNITKKYAQLLGVNEKEVINPQLYSFIDEWYGAPYKYGGKDKQGIDCSNFTAILYKEAFHKSILGSSSSLFEQCKVISKNELEQGDLLFFKIESNDVSHIAVYLQNNKFVHATTKKGVMIDDLDEAYYKKYFYKAGRIK